ncbi:hypothetical protein PRZ48_010661 [Zasmidium cellare]|uniref:Uncharacterized protein n=1 Tax=Zasmidium cellare TaxID=395010 RepID=A0ABR0E9A0_ZASCE|nr:hypothetical protein PRZ48_010661 [Zasmidium cellare]
MSNSNNQHAASASGSARTDDLPPPYSTSLPEHSCQTAAQAFRILEAHRQSKIRELDERESLLKNKAATIIAPIRQQLVDNLQRERQRLLADFTQSDNDSKAVVHAGQKFKFATEGLANDFVERRRKDLRVNLDMMIWDAENKGAAHVDPEILVQLGQTQASLRFLRGQETLAEKGQR